MLKLLARLAVPAALLLAAPACAQPAPQTRDADPALWVVRDADTTIYLFGTIHVLKPGLSWFDEGVKAAFDASQQVVLEIVTPDPQAMQALVMAQGMTRDGPTLTQKLPEKKRAAYLKALADLGLPQAGFDRMQPWFAATNLSLIPLMKMGYDPTNGPERVITEAAGQAGKPVIGLETAEQQIGYFGSLSQGAQVTFLTSTVAEMPKLSTTMSRMVDQWAAGNPAALGRTLNEGMRDSPEVARVLLVDRNKRWAKWIEQRLAQPGTVFIAVGAGHLAGGDSVQAQLAHDHVRAVRVKY